MANNSNLPHIKNVESGYNKYDPVHNAIFEIAFELPESLSSFGQEYVTLLGQQVTKVSGLDDLQKMPKVNSQKFWGVDVSFLEPTLENTYAELTCEFNLNLKDRTNNFVLAIFKAWSKLSYDLADGTRTLKPDYCSAKFIVHVANRAGEIWREVTFYDVMLYECTGLNDLDFTDKQAAKLTCKFRSDYWDETLTGSTESKA